MIELLKVLQPGDKTNIKSPENGKKLFFAGYDHFFAAGGVPCVFLAYDLENKNTFSRYTEKALNEYGYTSIKKGGVYMKKTYFCSLIDFNTLSDIKKPWQNIVFSKYIKGLKEARRLYDIPVSYNYNIKGFSGWKNGKQFIIKEV